MAVGEDGEFCCVDVGRTDVNGSEVGVADEDSAVEDGLDDREDVEDVEDAEDAKDCVVDGEAVSVTIDLT